MIRPADHGDLATLLLLERAASTAGLNHIFGPDIPFPEADVVARWRLVLDDPSAQVVIDELDDGPVGYAAFGGGWLRHLGVLPELWGAGRGRALHDFALSGLAAERTATAYLWVLVDNHRARAFYSRLDWVDTGVREVEVFAPYPVKMQMARALTDVSLRDGGASLRGGHS